MSGFISDYLYPTQRTLHNVRLAILNTWVLRLSATTKIRQKICRCDEAREKIFCQVVDLVTVSYQAVVPDGDDPLSLLPAECRLVYIRRAVARALLSSSRNLQNVFPQSSCVYHPHAHYHCLFVASA